MELGGSYPKTASRTKGQSVNLCRSHGLRPRCRYAVVYEAETFASGLAFEAQLLSVNATYAIRFEPHRSPGEWDAFGGDAVAVQDADDEAFQASIVCIETIEHFAEFHLAKAYRGAPVAGFSSPRRLWQLHPPIIRPRGPARRISPTLNSHKLAGDRHRAVLSVRYGLSFHRRTRQSRRSQNSLDIVQGGGAKQTLALGSARVLRGAPGSPLSDLLANFNRKLRPTNLDAFGLIPAFVRSLIFWASSFAKEESSDRWFKRSASGKSNRGIPEKTLLSTIG